MEIIAETSSLRARLKRESSIAFVPTMGSLHEGHLSLVHLAKQHADRVVVSIFVNRLQFAPSEDFDRYPRTLEDDCKLLQQQGVDIVFAPVENCLYPTPQEFMVRPSAVADSLEGEFRPGFFQGVSTVVLKLFNIAQPQIAVFGKKDFQQLHLVREMVSQFNLPLQVIAADTVRSPDNLACSSRNRYLTAEERAEAPRLYQVLVLAKRGIEDRKTDFNALEEDAKATLRECGWKVDYIAVRNRDTLAPAKEGDQNVVVLGAARLGNTRLIDNVEVNVKTSGKA